MTDSVYNIPAHLPFLRTLAASLLRRYEGNLSELAAVRILLPTRRACRALATTFLQLRQGQPTLLPRLLPLGDMGEGELLQLPPGLVAEDELLPAIAPLHRLSLLARTIQAKDPKITLHQALGLAEELARFLDELHLHDVSLDQLQGLVADEFSQHWQTTVDFLKLLSDVWPGILAAEKMMDPGERQRRTLQALAKGWQAAPPEHPVLAAGVSASYPAAIEVFRAIANAPQGSVILAGLDQHMTASDWQDLDPTHPQYEMRQMLEGMETARAEVKMWPHTEDEEAIITPRQRFLHHALRPAASTASWAEDVTVEPEDVKDIARLECDTQQEEAATIAALLREFLAEDNDKTVALITPDRQLARRVCAYLTRWNIKVDDSAGTPLLFTQIGTFLDLIARMVESDFAPVDMLAVLKHPFTALGVTPVECRQEARALEIDLLRGPRRAENLDGFLRLATADCAKYLRRLQEVTQPLQAALATPQSTFSHVLSAHLQVAEQLANSVEGRGSQTLWRGDIGNQAADNLRDILQATRDLPLRRGEPYGEALRQLLRRVPTRPTWGQHPRVFIWGLMEAQLQTADRIVLGGLTEGSWPALIEASSWLNRPMRQQLGLPIPEERTGQSAHHFQQAFHASEVFLTSARKVDGTPTVPSRWLQRMAALTSAHDISLTCRHPYQRWLQQLDMAAKVEPIARPQPRPATALRPRQYSVTDVERLMSDPYSFYARRILRLKPLEALDADPAAVDYGNFIHRLLDRLVRDKRLQGEVDFDTLLAEAARDFADLQTSPTLHGFWWPRLVRILEWFVEVEHQRAAHVQNSFCEVQGKWEVSTQVGPFTLIAKADRIDQLASGQVEIIDYKTGSAPHAAQLKSGEKPQLPLEILMLKHGGFKNIDLTSTASMAFWQLSGGEPAGKISDFEKLDMEALLKDTQAGLQHLLETYANDDMPYAAAPLSDRQAQYNDYTHLARTAEWKEQWG